MTGEPHEFVDLSADDPYEGVDIEELPAWWQDCLAEFEAHDLYTYVPATFSDGRVVRTVVESLESEYGISISLLRVGGGPGDEWTVRVDGTSAGTVRFTRRREGVSVVEIESETFADLVQSALAGEE